MTTLTLKEELEYISGVKVDLKINDNRSTMLSVKWETGKAKLSLHRMFLEAPLSIREALAEYLKKKKSPLCHEIKGFIEEGIRKLDYSHLLDQDKLYTQGTYYNLKKIYEKLNKEYFNNSLDLSITWFGKLSQKGKSRVTFGLYHEPLKLVKISRILDSPLFPDYVVDFVVYHEMVHAVCPSYYDKEGNHKIHTKEFKKMEEGFKYFALAQEWIDKNQNYLFVEWN